MPRFFEPTEINELLRRTTVKVTSPHDVGSGVLYKPSPTSPFVYVLTARHVLLGENGLPEDVSPNQVALKFLLNPDTNSYFEYQLQVSDLMLVSDNPQEDFATLVVPSVAIEQLIGELPSLTLVRETYGLTNCLFRGFPGAYEGEEPIRMEGSITESTKGSLYQFEWVVSQNLADPNDSRTAYENVQGFSGSGVFLIIEDEAYLLGIVSNFGRLNRFFGEKVAFLESLIKGKDQLPNPEFCVPEVRTEVRFALNKLGRNTQNVIKINDKIGEKVHLDRADLVNKLTEAISENSISIIFGEPGIGKSVTVKNCLVQSGRPFFAIKGEQINANNLDDVLASIIKAPIDFNDLFSSSLVGWDVAIWIDGTEKCVEQDTMGALIDLIQLTKEYPKLKLVFTIRKHVFGYFQFRILSGNSYTYEIPPLQKDEQDEVLHRFPSLKILLSNPRLRQLLTIPFYLDRAVSLGTLTNGLELNEYTFKNKIWLQKIVGVRKGLHREEVFINLAVNRVKAMELYTSVDEPEFEIVEELEREHILVRENETSDRFAPAHDIFEDWALVRYVRRIFQAHSTPAELLIHLGSEYTIRRGFRFWLLEEIHHQPEQLFHFIGLCLTDETIDKRWKDEIFIALLRVDECEQFLKENYAILLRDNAYLLVRFIHIFNVASKEPNSMPLEIKNDMKLYNYNFMSVEQKRRMLMHFLYNQSNEIEEYNVLYLFLLDWSSQLEWGTPLPSEAREAGIILLTIFQRMRNSHVEGLMHPQNEMRKEILRLIFRLTEVIEFEVKTILEETLNEIKAAKGKSHRLRGDFELLWKQVLFFFHCRELCRYFPDLIMEIAKLRWLKRKKSEYESSFDVNQYFGLIDEYRLDDFPASAWQTPTLWLLRFHPDKALDWIIDLMNFTTQKYLESESSKSDENEDALEIELRLNDGTNVKQFGSHTLYQMFRGTRRVTPYLLQSILMALEKWLLELAESREESKRSVLRSSFKILLEESKTVATTSVLVSVAIAYPDEVGEQVYPLLTNLAIFDWDFDRMIQESSALSPIGAGEYGLYYQKERFEAKQLPHRKIRLEEYVTNRSFNDLAFRSKFQEILDQLWMVKSPESPTWRIFLNRMDIRKWETTNIEESDGKYIMEVQPKIEDDLLPIVEEARIKQKESNSIAATNIWAQKVFDDEYGVHFNFENWLTHYNLIRNVEHLELEGLTRMTFSPALLAAVAIRDGLDELNADQFAWCENTLFTRAKMEVDAARRMYPDLSMAKSPFEDVPCLLSLVLLLRKQPNSKLRPDVIVLLFEALLFIELSDNLKNKLFDYVRDNLWTIDEDIAHAYWIGLINYASIWRKYPRYGYEAHLYDELKTEVERFEKEKSELIQSVLNQTIVLQKLPEVLDTRSHWWYDKALKILPFDTQDDHCRKFVEQYLNLLLKVGTRSGYREQPHQFNLSRQYFAEYFAKFIFAQRKEVALPLFDQLIQAVLQDESYDQSIFEFVQRSIEEIMLTIYRNDNLDTQTFGFYWKYLLNSSIATNSDYFSSRLLLESQYWNDQITNWQPILDNKATFIEIIQKVGQDTPNSVVRLLAGIGSDILLPKGLIWLCEILQKRGVEQIKVNDMERLLKRILISHAASIRKNRDLLKSLMAILDLMVEKGSSFAFFMRESLFGG